MSKWETAISATGSDGNVFTVIGTARRLMKELGAPPAEIKSLSDRAMKAASYDEAISIVREWFPVITDKDC